MKYVDLSALNFGWTQVALNPYRSTGIRTAPIVVIINGCFGLLYIVQDTASPNRVFKGCYLVLTNKNGQQCTYATPNYKNNDGVATYNNVTLSDITQNISINGNTIIFSLVNNTSVFTWRVPTIFSPGVNYIVPFTSTAVSPPCPGATDYGGAFYLKDQQLIAYEYSHTVASLGTYYASIYDMSNRFLGGGFIGQSSAGDPFNQIPASRPSGTQQMTNFTRDGINIYMGPLNAGNFIGLTTPQLVGDYTQLVCGSPNPSVYITSKTNALVYPFRDFGCPVIQSQASAVIPSGYTDIPGFSVFPDLAKFHVVSNDWFLDFLAPQFVTHAVAIAYVKEQGCWFHHIQNPSQVPPVGPDPIFIATSAQLNGIFTQYGLLPQVQQSGHNGLINMHRAVSINGSYIT